MKTYYECIPCLVRQTVEAVSMTTDNSMVQEKIIRSIMVEIANMDLNLTPPHMARLIHRRIKDMLATGDIYKEIKERFNRFALNMYPDLKRMVYESDNRFATAVYLAIAGNIIDFGVRADIDEDDVFQTIEECLNSEVVFNSPAELHEAVDRSGKILFLGDNAGEIVFDKLLLEMLPIEKISYVVKGYPIINDATWEDALATGMTDMVRVIDNGSDAPGTILELCSTQFQKEFHQADMIIAKGQANYETLSDVKDKNIFFLLKVKCPVIARDLGCSIGSVVIKSNS